ncbi:MAG: hypothetical protein C4346_14260 [Chloroflexota bacterium]
MSWIVTEMKTGDIEPADVQKQLQAGADALVNSQIYTPDRCTFVPLVVRDRRRGRVHVAERQVLDRLKVTFGSTRRTILIEPCGSRVSRIVR